MTKLLESIEERFAQVRFGGDCADLRSFAQEALAVPRVVRHGHVELYYELLSNIVKSLFFESCGGTLSTDEKLQIFALIQEDWSDEAPEGIRASMLTLLGLIQPLAGVPEWLISVAQRQRDTAYAEALRGCAACSRTKPAV